MKDGLTAPFAAAAIDPLPGVEPGVPRRDGFAQHDLLDWDGLASRELNGAAPRSLTRRTAEGLEIKPLYTEADIEGLETLGTMPGFAPYLRGVRATMYANRPWTIRQYAGFSTAEESNAAYRESLAAGQTGLSVAFDLPTQRGYDSDHPDIAGEVGMAGIAIDSVEDMKRLFADIPLDRTSVSMTMNGAVLPVLAAYIVAGLEGGARLDQLGGTIQNDILKEFIVRNTYIYPPGPSMRIVGDIVAYASKHMPRLNAVSISGYHMHEAGATAVQELAFTLANGLDYVRTALANGLDVDAFAPRLSFFFAVGMDVFTEVAKLRAARLLWAERMRRFGPKKPESLALRMHSQTSGVSLTAQEPYNNIVRTTIEALAAVLGGTQSLHTNSFDEALGLPTQAAARIARDTQHIIAEETGIARVVDPLGGSYYVEHLTASVADATRALIDEIEGLGGMTEAIALGMPQRLIAEAAARRQARLDSGEDVLVGVNKHRAPPSADGVDVLRIDPARVRSVQIARLQAVRATRDRRAVEAALGALGRAAATGDGNLLALSIEAMRLRATVGEVSAALERVFSRHEAASVVAEGTYAGVHAGAAELAAVRAAADRFAEREGCRPRILIAKLGQDGHDRGAKVIAGAFADFGFEVHLGPLFQTPAEAARMAIARAVHVIGVSTHAGGHMTLVPALNEALRDQGARDVMVVCGGVVPQEDRPALKTAGVVAIYGPGTNLPGAAADLLARLADRNAQQADRGPDGAAKARHDPPPEGGRG